MNSQKILDSLNWRYATKAFDPARKIDESLWADIEESLVLTPSSFGLQPWRFFVIQDDQLRAQLLPHSWGQTQVTDCSHFLVIASEVDVTSQEIDHFLERTVEIRGGSVADLAPYREMMVGFTERMDAESKLAWAKHQAYIALGQAMTTAALLEIDACPMEGIVPAEYDHLLGLADKGLTTTVCCAFGYRSAEDKYATLPKVRHPKEAMVTRL